MFNSLVPNVSESQASTEIDQVCKLSLLSTFDSCVSATSSWNIACKLDVLATSSTIASWSLQSLSRTDTKARDAADDIEPLLLYTLYVLYMQQYYYTLYVHTLYAYCICSSSTHSMNTVFVWLLVITYRNNIVFD
jgi:hypothetical protein